MPGTFFINHAAANAEIRDEQPADRAAVWAVNRAAFGGDGEPRLVEALTAGGFTRLSLVATVDKQIVGHILFSRLPIVAEQGGVTATVEALSLAPMCVLPDWQRRGIGSQLVSEGLNRCRAAGHRIVVVLGHAEFYPRFGFSAQLAEAIASPYGGSAAWMAIELQPGALDKVAGQAEYPPPFAEL